MEAEDALKICYALFVEKFSMGTEGGRGMRKLLWHMVEELGRSASSHGGLMPTVTHWLASEMS